MTVGVLALQGAFIEHVGILEELGVNTREIRKRSDFDETIDGLILPGGESTTMGKLLHETELYHPIRSSILNGMPVFGTCAGMILLAEEITNNSVVHLGTMHMTVKRNAYGRQLASFHTYGSFGNEDHIEMPFIRAPYIESVQKDVQVLSVIDGEIVAAREKNQLVTSFHPELTKDYRVHQYFLNMMKERNGSVL
ncbi:MAG: pyridoxal 5'-phosphate synthase glutaminase subunit PdxT [Clostridia bacterium]